MEKKEKCWPKKKKDITFCRFMGREKNLKQALRPRRRGRRMDLNRSCWFPGKEMFSAKTTEGLGKMRGRVRSFPWSQGGTGVIVIGAGRGGKVFGRERGR